MQLYFFILISFSLLIRLHGATAASLPRLARVKSILERDLSSSPLIRNDLSAQKANGSLSLPSLQGQQVHIPFPIINSSMTIVSTELGDATIPIDRVSNFFIEALQETQFSVQNTPNRPITPYLWFFKSHTRIDRSVLSLSIYTRQSQSQSWIQLYKLLKGLESFMSSQRRTLVFDIEILGKGPVAEGLVWYSPPGSLNIEAKVKRESEKNDSTQRMLNKSGNPSNLFLPTPSFPSPLTAVTTYPVPSSPVTLKINPNGPPVACLFLEACLTNMLRKMSPEVRDTPDGRIPHNRFSYHDLVSGVAVAYLGYVDSRWLTWQQLSWTLAGLLGFFTEHQENCRAMAVEICMVGETEQVTFGGLILWYIGDESTIEA